MRPGGDSTAAGWANLAIGGITDELRALHTDRRCGPREDASASCRCNILPAVSVISQKRGSLDQEGCVRIVNSAAVTRSSRNVIRITRLADGQRAGRDVARNLGLHQRHRAVRIVDRYRSTDGRISIDQAEPA